MTVFFRTVSKSHTKTLLKNTRMIQPFCRVRVQKSCYSVSNHIETLKILLFWGNLLHQFEGFVLLFPMESTGSKNHPKPQKTPRVLAPRMELEWPNFCRGETTRFFFSHLKKRGQITEGDVFDELKNSL